MHRSGTWIGVNSARGADGALPSEQLFADSPNKFSLTLERAGGSVTLAAAQVTRYHTHTHTERERERETSVCTNAHTPAFVRALIWSMDRR